MQHVADDVLCVLLRLLPGHLDGAGRQRLGPHLCGGPGEPVGPQHGEAGAGLRGAGAVLGDALVDGVVLLADAVDGQRAAGERDTERSQLQPGLYHTHTRDNRLIIIIITGDSIHLGGQAEACAHLRNNAIIINRDSVHSRGHA